MSRLKSAKRRSCASKKRCNRLFPAAVLSIAAADIRIKQYVEDNVPQGHDRPTLGGRILLRKVYNSGAAFGLLHGSPRLVTGLSALLGALLAARDALLLKRRGRILEKTGMALLTGGALSNTGAGDLIGNMVAKAAATMQNDFLIYLMFFLIPFLLTQVMQNRAVMLIFIPIAIQACKSMGANPVGVIICVQAACLTAFMTPMATPTVPYFMAAGGYDLKSVVKQSLLPALLFCALRS